MNDVNATISSAAGILGSLTLTGIDIAFALSDDHCMVVFVASVSSSQETGV